MNTNILHISDLHISSKYIKDIEIVLEALIKDIQKIGKEIHCILFNGDLINNGSLGAEEYRLAEEKFIIPLLKVTGLTKDKFFLVPGNHDVNRGKIREYVDKGITQKFHDRDSLNKFIDNIDANKDLFMRLEDFSKFVDDLHGDNQYIVSKNPMYSSYAFDHGDMKIGIACLNSAWGSFGGNEDLSNLLVGERQVDLAISDLNNCQIKIAMIHHPFEWLKEFDRLAIQDRLITNFDLVLTGHIHNPDFKQMVFNNCKSILLKCGALFQGRTLNGYNLICINSDTNEVEIFLREYFDKRRAFDKAISIVEEGYSKYQLAEEKKVEVLKKNINVKGSLRKKVLLDINRKLITTISPDSIAPKELSEIYVPPVISTQSEHYAATSENENEIQLEDVLNGEDNLLFIGKKEIGKSTLLDYIFNFYMNQRKSGFEKIPFIINFNDIPKGKNVFEKAMTNFLCNYGIYDFNVEENLLEGNCVILIDDFHLKNGKNIEKMREFAKKYPNNRICITMSEDILQAVKITDIPDLGFNYDSYYIYTFRRFQVRQLVKKWFLNTPIDDDLILDRIITSLKSIGVPRTPLTISLFLWILEKQTNYVPLNEASLLEKFIEILLEKLNFEDARYEALDFTIKTDFLAYIALLMVRNDKYYFDSYEIEREIINYFEQKGLDVDIHQFKKIFFEKGIFISYENRVYFRFKCFLEFFIAKAMEMPENQDFKNFILTEENYLKFTNEIVYFTGLNRRSKEILLLIENRLKDSFSPFDSVDFSTISNLPVKEILTEAIKQEAFLDKLEEMKLSDEEKDKILEDRREEPNGSFVVEKSEKNEVGKFPKEEASKERENIENLHLFAKIIKNSELINKEDKQRALGICINKYCQITGMLYKSLYEILQESIREAKETGNELDGIDEQMLDMLSIGLPIIMQSSILNNLGTPKLKIIIEKQIELAETDFEKLMLVSLYADLRLEGYINKFEVFLKENKSKLFREISIAKLIYYNNFYKKTQREEEQLLGLIADLIAEANGIPKRGKTHIISKYKKQNLINQSKQRNLLD